MLARCVIVIGMTITALARAARQYRQHQQRAGWEYSRPGNLLEV
jgi:hypothetical protein